MARQAQSEEPSEWTLLSATEEMLREHRGVHFTQRPGWHIFMLAMSFLPVTCAALVGHSHERILRQRQRPAADGSSEHSSSPADCGWDASHVSENTLANRIAALERTVSELALAVWHSPPANNRGSDTSLAPTKAAADGDRNTSSNNAANTETEAHASSASRASSASDRRSDNDLPGESKE
jgi:hypothetical protein